MNPTASPIAALNPIQTTHTLLEWISTYGLAITLVAVALGFAVVFGVIWLKRFAKKDETVLHEKPLDHSFFVETEAWISRAKTLRLKSEFRTLVIRDYQRILWTKLSEALDTFCKNEVNAMSQNVFANQLRECLSRGYDEALRGFKEEGIPERMVEKFDSALRVPLTMLFNAAEKVSNDSALVANTQKVWMFLNLMEAFLATMGSEFISIMDKINGEFDGLTYKGVAHSKSGTIEIPATHDDD